MMKHSKNQGGFTLIEVMVVVVILGILASLVIPRIMDAPNKARWMQVEQNLFALKQALDLYYLDNQFYPSTDQGLQALAQKPTTPPLPIKWKKGGYIDTLSPDPWGNSYLYLNPGLHGEIDIFSYGADGQAGGTGYNADVGNWNLTELSQE